MNIRDYKVILVDSNVKEYEGLNKNRLDTLRRNIAYGLGLESLRISPYTPEEFLEMRGASQSKKPVLLLLGDIYTDEDYQEFIGEKEYRTMAYGIFLWESQLEGGIICPIGLYVEEQIEAIREYLQDYPDIVLAKPEEQNYADSIYEAVQEYDRRNLQEGRNGIELG